MTGALTLALAIVVVVFVIENNHPASLLFFGWSSPSLPFALYIVSALLIGVGIGVILSWVARARVKQKISRTE
ncbi:lipopolysaccharide assembly protein LapA domain-containing protein [Pseudomonas sp. BGI-2]|uniref:lipopolysaccharide assembly protein LapA domain-containing protein n=1 Tax=Pseudomonas sp. BGI-2 TaxID=2528211 RepID=UPI0010341CB9|nr:lipopolysaccharide assembly protein LapA domain-containing protein [Pseudomonas sp. BGI-2]TBN43356.1 LapA family protein [Pseudomonas sp. BGI-2]